MKLHKKLTPVELQKLLFESILPDFIITFFFFGIIFTALSIYVGVFSMTIRYLLIFFPALVFLAGFFSLIRFYKHIFAHLRILDSFSSFYNSFGEGECSMVVAFPEPLLFWKGILRDGEKTDEDSFFYMMEIDSNRYTVHVKCVLEGSDYTLWALVEDWRNDRHVKRMEGNYAEISSEAFEVINSIHNEVVKGEPSRGEIPEEFNVEEKPAGKTKKVAPPGLEEEKEPQKGSEAQKLKERLEKAHEKPKKKKAKKSEEGSKPQKLRERLEKGRKKDKEETEEKKSEEKEAKEKETEEEDETLSAFDEVSEDLEED